MNIRPGAWVRQLRLDAEQAVKPVCSAEVLGPAIEQLGPEPVEWAVLLAADIAVKCAESFPEYGDSPASLATLRWGIESSTISATRTLESGRLPAALMSNDAMRAVHEFVHRGIPLRVVWASMRQGHGWLAEAFMAACVELAPPQEQSRELLHISDMIFRFTDQFTDAFGGEYSAESTRWTKSIAAEREDMVKALLAGESADVSRAENVLRYQIAHRTHVGMVMWLKSANPVDEVGLSNFVTAVLRGAGAEHILCVPQGLTSVFAWGNKVGDFRLEGIGQAIGDHADVRAAIGEPCVGLEGFVLTHQQAREARSVAETLPGLGHALTRFGDVRLLSLLVQDVEASSRFVADVLGELSYDEPHLVELRRTALAYLQLDRSPSAAATELFISRSTVRYRLKKVEELLERTLSGDVIDLWVALALRERM